MRKDDFDPISYIESAFLDFEKPQRLEEEKSELAAIEAEEFPVFARSAKEAPTVQLRQESAEDAPQPKELSRSLVNAIRDLQKPEDTDKQVKLKTTQMSAPRPRRRKTPTAGKVVAPEMEQIWRQLPKNMKFLAGVYDDNVTRKYYSSGFKESREELILRMIDPQLNLEETARLLGVCPATVRRYTNRGWLEHHRTTGNQRRFKLSGIVNFVERYGRNPE